jgi:hypothetical protein
MGRDGNIQTLGGRLYRRSELREASSNGKLMRLTVSSRRGDWRARSALICVGMYRLQEQLKATQPRPSRIPLGCPYRRQIIVIYLR